MNPETKTADKSNHEEIAEVAYQFWDKAGRQEGHDLEYWLKAEKQFPSSAPGETKRQPAAQRAFSR